MRTNPSMLHKQILRLGIVIAVAGLQACDDTDASGPGAAADVAATVPLSQLRPPSVDADSFAARRRELTAWFECEECSSRELDTVIAQGTHALPTLKATLERGPSAARLEMLRLELEQSYDRLEAYAASHPEARPTLDREAYVRLYQENFVALHRGRAARALGGIGGPEARQALELAAQSKHREDVLEAVRAALGALK